MEMLMPTPEQGMGGSVPHLERPTAPEEEKPTGFIMSLTNQQIYAAVTALVTSPKQANQHNQNALDRVREELVRAGRERGMWDDQGATVIGRSRPQ